jgi:putative membrane protein
LTVIPLLNAFLFAALALAVFAAALAIAGKLLPFDLRKEIVEERNVAAAIVAGAVALALAWIIAATMH